MKSLFSPSCLSYIITIFLLVIILYMIHFSFFCAVQENLESYGESNKTKTAPLAYEIVSNQIKYPAPDSQNIYDVGDTKYNNLLFNKEGKQMHYSEYKIMKDLKYFNNASNLLLDHYLNDNSPNTKTIYSQKMEGENSYTTLRAGGLLTDDDLIYKEIGFEKDTVDSSDTYLYDYSDRDDRQITRQMVYQYRMEDGYDPLTSNVEPKNGSYLVKNITSVGDEKLDDHVYNYDYDMPMTEDESRNYEGIYDQLIAYNNSIFPDISNNPTGKYSSHYFESNYGDTSDNITRDFKYFFSTAPILSGSYLFNES